MRSWERRLKELEEKRAQRAVSEADTSNPSRRAEIRDFISGMMRFMGRIRRAPIDPPEIAYRTQDLYELEPWPLAMYVCALSLMEHPDEYAARVLLQEVCGDDTSLFSLVEGLLERLRERREEEASA